MRRLFLRQLDRRVASIVALPFPSTHRGWIKSIREALNITQGELAGRLGTTQQAVERLEKAEANKKSVSLARLERATQAIDCKVVYAIVPRTDASFSAILERYARAAATRHVNSVDRHMTLENQATGEAFRLESIDDLTQELMRTFSKEIWETR